MIFTYNFFSKSLSLQLWLFGYELSDTMIGLSKDQKMVIVTSKKKADFLKPICSSKGNFRVFRNF